VDTEHREGQAGKSESGAFCPTYPTG